MTATAIRATGLSKRYGRARALADVSFAVARGEVIGLLGPNGAGKTTLMKILTGALAPDAGRVEILGADALADPPAAQRKLGYLPETAPLYRDMRVQEYLDTMAALRGVAAGVRRERVAAAIRATGLVERAIAPIATLSKGYRQRVGIAQAIVHAPDILILDEPTTGLDPAQIVEIRELIAQLAKTTTVVLSTHILSEVEASCERVLVLIAGELRADAKLADLRASNAAVVAIERGADGVATRLGAIAGVTAVTEIGVADGANTGGEFRQWRVTSSATADVCPAIYAVLKATAWRVGELRADRKTLERVFRELAAGAGEARSP